MSIRTLLNITSTAGFALRSPAKHCSRLKLFGIAIAVIIGLQSGSAFAQCFYDDHVINPKLQPAPGYEDIRHTYVCYCGELMFASTMQDHTFVPGQTQAATCTVPGYSRQTCSVCDYIKDTTPTAALGHNMVSNSHVAATCTTAGYTVNKCSRCTETNQVNPIAAPGHNWPVAWAFDDHNHWHECTRCTETNGTATHDYDAGVVTTPPSSLAAGVLTISCDDCAYAYTDVVDDFTWYTTNGEVVVTGYIGTNSSMTVPEKRGVTVTEIGSGAFMIGHSNASVIVTVALPSTVTVIGTNAFNGLTALTSIDLSFVTNIGAYAFDGAGLTKVSLNSGQTIGAGAFDNTPMNFILVKGNAPSLTGNLIEETKPIYYLPTYTNGWTAFTGVHTNTVPLTSAIDENTLADDAGGFAFDVTDNSGGALDLTVVIEATPVLTPTTWDIISTNDLSVDRTFVDPAAPALPSRFYRTKVIDAN